MRLNRGGRKNYGIPYQGSKTKVIDSLARFFPNADHFYDLFGGGFSVTHYMLENRRKSYKNFHFNEIRPGICDLVRDAIDGKYNFEVFKPEFISRERFLVDKETNPYIKIVWSFGNNGEDYLFGQDIIEQKKSMHQAVVFDEFDNWFKSNFKIDQWPNKMDVTGKRLYLRMLVRKIGRIDLQRLQRLEQLERLQRLQRLQRLEQLELTCLDYRQVRIEPNSVIYCDIPYYGTADYGSQFNHKDFFDWADAHKEPVFISEYNISDERFGLITKIAHRSTYSNGNNSATYEKLYGNKAACKIIEDSLTQAAKTN